MNQYILSAVAIGLIILTVGWILYSKAKTDKKALENETA